MYNRYIPQPDGSYRKNTIQDKTQNKPNPAPQPSQPEKENKDCIPSPPKEKQCSMKKKEQNSQCKTPITNNDVSIGNFLKQLLPKDLDSGDLLVIILLLLMAGDCQDNKNHALLTLMLYLFL